MITKLNEINMLRELATNDTYFADEFSNEDTQQMCENIANDYHLLMGTGYIKFTNNELDSLRIILHHYRSMALETGFGNNSTIDKLYKKINKNVQNSLKHGLFFD